MLFLAEKLFINMCMTWTNWHFPRAAAELAANEIGFGNYSGSATQGFVSLAQTRSISTSYGTYVREETNSVLFTDFGFAAVQPQGIQLRLRTRRQARIQDKVIQLWDGVRAISENQQNLSAEDEQLYGDSDNVWGVPAAVNIPVDSVNFGVIIDLQPHTEIPCADLVYIRSVAMRLYLPE